ncbi:MAG: 1,4-dihydroxy-2-naphthoyl-CoA hydrolase [Thermoleophilaceae bacterium]|nr:1,4-dihydroxy-2-naphthoyl-CoA hydrolase [Thermoleophilaceae bacterium]
MEQEVEEPIAIPDFEHTLDGVIGFEVLEMSGERVRARLEVHDRVRQRFGVVHGGTFCAWAEVLASEATTCGVARRGSMAMGMSNATSFLRPVREGVIFADGRPRHRGRTTWVWDIDFVDAGGRLCSTSRVTLAVMPAPAEGARPLVVE